MSPVVRNITSLFKGKSDDEIVEKKTGQADMRRVRKLEQRIEDLTKMVKIVLEKYDNTIQELTKF